MQRLGWIDWLKAMGITIIVYGHIADYTIFHLTRPVYPKQLGVVFFFLILGFMLARDQRAVRTIIFNRFFELFLFGIGIALLLTAISLAQGQQILKSNYAPFVLGFNVFFDHFPANPTTWYIGTYIHFVLLGAILLRRIRISVWLLLPVIFLEIITRALLIRYSGDFVAYQVLPNWISVFLVGALLGRLNWMPTSRRRWFAIGSLAAILILWPWISGQWGVEKTFPFMRLLIGDGFARLLATSLAVTTIYLAFGLIAYTIFSEVRSPRVVRFLADNTLIVFIGHMPLLYALQPSLEKAIESQWQRIAVGMLIYLVLLAFVSQLVRSIIRAPVLRERIRGLKWNTRPPEPKAIDRV